jgi:uncharacterized protein YigE (DUF2233 family)
MDKRLLFAVFASGLLASGAHAVECATAKFAGLGFTTCRVDASREALRLYYADSSQQRYRGFARLDASLAKVQRRLVFAMNAGMFHSDFRPVGLLVIDGREIAPINRATATGNFYLRPNGVFLVDAAGPRVLATDDYRDLAPSFATQSGPMLLHKGRIPDIAAFRSKSRHRRNGVCVPEGSSVAFVISESAVTFREFAEYFSAVLKCGEALYFDGAISSLFAPALKRADSRAELGPMVAVVE